MVVTSHLKTASVGFDTTTVGIGLPISPIYILSDAYFSDCIVSPPLPEGLSLNVSNRTISGVYNGEEAKFNYQVTCTDQGDHVKFPLAISFRKACSELIMMNRKA